MHRRVQLVFLYSYKETAFDHGDVSNTYLGKIVHKFQELPKPDSAVHDLGLRCIF